MSTALSTQTAIVHVPCPAGAEATSPATAGQLDLLLLTAIRVARQIRPSIVPDLQLMRTDFYL